MLAIVPLNVLNQLKEICSGVQVGFKYPESSVHLIRAVWNEFYSNLWCGELMV